MSAQLTKENHTLEEKRRNMASTPSTINKHEKGKSRAGGGEMGGGGNNQLFTIIFD